MAYHHASLRIGRSLSSRFGLVIEALHSRTTAQPWTSSQHGLKPMLREFVWFRSKAVGISPPMNSTTQIRRAKISRPVARAPLAQSRPVRGSSVSLAVRRLIVLLLLAAACFAVWKIGLEKVFVAKRWGVVEEGCIYRSGQLSQYLVKPTYQKHGIQVVIDLTEDELDTSDRRAERAAIAELGITLQRCPLVGDGTGDVARYTAALRAMVIARRRSRPVVVHCSAGAQRTGGVIAAYQLLFERAAPETVLSEMRRFGWRPGRDEVLRDYLNAHLPEMAEQLSREGYLPQVPDPLPRL